MKFYCTISQDGGQWVVRHESAQLGQVRAKAASRDEAIEKIRGELRYRLELCPCTGESYQHLDVEVEER